MWILACWFTLLLGYDGIGLSQPPAINSHKTGQQLFWGLGASWVSGFGSARTEASSATQSLLGPESGLCPLAGLFRPLRHPGLQGTQACKGEGGQSWGSHTGSGCSAWDELAPGPGTVLFQGKEWTPVPAGHLLAGKRDSVAVVDRDGDQNLHSGCNTFRGWRPAEQEGRAPAEAGPSKAPAEVLSRERSDGEMRPACGPRPSALWPRPPGASSWGSALLRARFGVCMSFMI